MDEIKKLVLSWLPSLGVTALIIVIGILVTWLICKITRKAMKAKDVDKSLASFILRTIKLVAAIIILIASLSQLGVSTTGLIASFSAALAAVALALKDNLSDLASGIVILFTRPFVTGDFIETGDQKGFVQKIDLLHTNILTYNETNVIIPNSKLTTNAVNNYSAHPEVRVELVVPVGYNADIEQVKKILLETMKNTEHVLNEGKFIPKARLERYGDSALEFTARCYCLWENYWPVYYAVIEGVKKALDEHDIPIPYNQLDVHLVSGEE